MAIEKDATWRSRKGAHYEQAAMRHLYKHGLRLIERNYRCTMGEIDLVMRDGGTLVFVEVRFRASSHFGAACETVDRRKQQKLLRSARYFLLGRKQFANCPCRFDVVGISVLNQQMHITWLKNAFQ